MAKSNARGSTLAKANRGFVRAKFTRIEKQILAEMFGRRPPEAVARAFERMAVR